MELCKRNLQPEWQPANVFCLSFWTHRYLQTGLKAAAQCIQRLNTCGILWATRCNIGKVWLAWHSPHVKRCEDGECAKGEIIEWKKHRVGTTKTPIMGYSEVLKGTQGAKSASFHNRLKQLKGIQTDCNRTKDPEMLSVLKLFAFIELKCSLPWSQESSNLILGHTDPVYIPTTCWITL